MDGLLESLEGVGRGLIAAREVGGRVMRRDFGSVDDLHGSG